MSGYEVVKVSYNATYKVIGRHPDGRIFAVRLDRTPGLHVLDRDLNLVSTLTTNFSPKINNCLILSTGTMIAWGTYVYDPDITYIYRSDDTSYTTFTVTHQLPFQTCLIERSVAVSSLDDTIMMSEYTMEPYDNNTGLWTGPETQSIWKSSDDGQTWTVVFTVNRNPQSDTSTVRHLHTIEYDPFANLFWFGSGDLDSQSKIWKMNADGTDATLIGGGSQVWRATSIVFTENYITWGSDSNFGDFAYARLDRLTEQKEDLLVPDDCIRLTESVETLSGDTVLVSNKSYERGATNPGTMELYLCDDGEGRAWRSVYTWQVMDAAIGTSVALFYNLTDNKDGRFYAHARNVKDEFGADQANVTIIMDINNFVSATKQTQTSFVINQNGTIVDVFPTVNINGEIKLATLSLLGEMI